MKGSRPGKRTEAASAVTPAGLSRRGWILLVGSTVAVAVAAVFVAIAALLTGVPAGQAQAHTSPAPHTQSSLAPHPDPVPGPLGLPPRPTPTTPVATVPSQPVDTLTTGDCLQIYPSKWADAYPVVDCATPHIAQLLTRGVLPQPAGAPFPGAQALDAQVTDLCGADDLMNWDWVAVWNEDVQIDMRYPNTAAQWESGARSYYCFVFTYSHHELTGSAVAVH